MADLHIHREHHLGLDGARAVAREWASHVQQEFDMQCVFAEGRDGDVVRFSRAGVNGTLEVGAEAFELRAKLGFLLGAFKGRIEAEIVKNLDALLQRKPPKRAAGKKA
ncbi:MAG: polyhydroxyalkanoic acid system family protein [Rhodoferax sp.]